MPTRVSESFPPADNAKKATRDVAANAVPNTARVLIMGSSLGERDCPHYDYLTSRSDRNAECPTCAAGRRHRPSRILVLKSPVWQFIPPFVMFQPVSAKTQPVRYDRII